MDEKETNKRRKVLMKQLNQMLTPWQRLHYYLFHYPRARLTRRRLRKIDALIANGKVEKTYKATVL